MVTVIAASEPDILGFGISGRLTRADYEEILLPAVQDRIANGEPIRILAVIHDFHGLEPGTLPQDLMAVTKLGSRQRVITPRFAVVSDTDWVRRAIALFGRLVPGEIRVFTTIQRADAETWLATAGEP